MLVDMQKDIASSTASQRCQVPRNLSVSISVNLYIYI